MKGKCIAKCSPLRNRGFSLVELSIVLVILGLLTGGILGGQALMRAAELRSIPTDYQKFQSAIHTFKDKYFAYPGDMPNAFSFWSGKANCGTDEIYSASAPTGCNGNGSGMWDHNWFQGHLAWKHLANAGLVEGSFNGVDRGETSIIGEDFPPSKLSSLQWRTWGRHKTSQGFTAGPQLMAVRAVLTLSKANASTVGALNSEEMWNIDTKMDDGKPGQGKVTVYVAGNCASTTNIDTAEYKLNSSVSDCALVMELWK